MGNYQTARDARRNPASSPTRSRKPSAPNVLPILKDCRQARGERHRLLHLAIGRKCLRLQFAVSRADPSLLARGRSRHGRFYSVLEMSPAATNAANFDLPIGLSHRPRDGNVVSFLHCMNDPQPEGSHCKLHRSTKILSHASRRRGRVAARGARAAAGDAGDDRVWDQSASFGRSLR